MIHILLQFPIMYVDLKAQVYALTCIDPCGKEPRNPAAFQAGQIALIPSPEGLFWCIPSKVQP